MSDSSSRLFRLRPLEKTDLETVTCWLQDVEDLASFDRTNRVPLNQSQTERLWSSSFGTTPDDSSCWFIIESEDREAVGLAGLDAISRVNRDAVIPLFVDKSIRRYGVGLRATALILDFAFRQLGLNRVTSYYRGNNHTSRDLVAKVGFQIEGTMRQAWFADGEFHDMMVVGILRQEWMAHRKVMARKIGPETVVSFGPGASAIWSWPPKEA